MRNSICEVLLPFLPKISEFEDLHSTYVTNCVFSSFLCYTAIMLNIVTIFAIRRTSSLPKTLKTLLLSLAVSDVGVGLLSQPFYISLLVMWLQQSDPGCNTYKGFAIVSWSIALASFFGVIAVSVDRFLAIHLHLRYQELVTHKRVVAVVISIWVLSLFLSLIILWAPFYFISGLRIILGGVGFFVTAVVYIRIYFVVQRHENQIHVLQVQQAARNDEIANLTSLVKSAFGILYVFLLFLICCLPSCIVLVVYQISGPSIPLKKVYLSSWTLMVLNSSLNPVIYCWKMAPIRHAVMDILRNMFWFRNGTSH